MHLEALPDQTRRVLSDLAGMPEIGNFILIGGTALTLHLGHRQSEDLDFMYAGPQLPRNSVKAIISALEKTGYKIKDAIDLGERESFDDGGGDLDDFHQDWRVDDVKVTFVAIDFGAQAKGFDAASYADFGKVRILGVEGIFVLKSRLLVKRTASRDFFDLWCLLEKEDKEFAEVITHAHDADRFYDEDRVKRKLLKDNPPKSDPGFAPMIEGAPRDLKELRGKFADIIDLYEENRAEAIRRGQDPGRPPSDEAPQELANNLIDALGIPLAKFLLKSFLGPFGDLAADSATGLLDMAKKKISAYSDQRRAERLFTDIGDQVAQKLLPSFEKEAGKGQIDGGAMARELADTLETEIPQGLLDKKDLDPAKISDVLRKKRPFPKKKYSKEEWEFYFGALDETVRYLVETADRLPAFKEEDATQTLKRLGRMTDDIERVLDTVQHIEQAVAASSLDDKANRFEADYRQAVIRNLDYLELFGADISEESRHHALSVAYVSLNLESGKGKDQSITHSAEDLLDGLEKDSGRLLVRGEAGSGKSTLFRWAAIKAAEITEKTIPRFEKEASKLHPGHWRRRIPFLVRLRDCKEGELPDPENFPSLIAGEIGAPPEAWVLTSLRQGRALVLLDGVDEVPNLDRDKMLQQIKAIVKAYPKSQFLVSTRPAAVEEGWLAPLDFREARINPMSAVDRGQFIGKWHEAIERELEKQGKPEDLNPLAGELKAQLEDNPPIARLGTNPLLCAMICALHRDRSQKLPESQAELCETLCQMLLHKREREGGLDLSQFPESYRELHYPQKRAILQDIAYHMVREEKSSIELSLAEEKTSQSLEGLSGRSSRNAREICHALIERSGVLREARPGHVDFIHNTLKEFLAADRFVEKQDVFSLAEHALESNWQPVLMFASATQSRRIFASELVTKILEPIQNNMSESDSRALKLVALKCRSAALYLKLELKEKLADIEKDLFPPHGMAEAESLAAGGDSVVDSLKFRRRNAREAAACVRTLRLIGTRKAKKRLEGYLHDRRKTVYSELAQAVNPLKIPAVIDLVSKGKRFPDNIASQITDLSPLSSLKGLQSLVLWGTQVSDLSPLASLKDLQSLDLWGTQVSDFSPLASLKGLQSLDLWGTQVSDLSPLASLKGLQSLDLTSTQVSDFSPLASLKGLQSLVLRGTQVSDLSPLASLKGLQSLNLGGTQVSDLSPLASLKRLQSLVLWETQVSDLSPLFGLKKLKKLNILETQVTDLGPLKNKPGLKIRQ